MSSIEGLLSYVRDKYPHQITQAKEQQLYRHVDTKVDYMSFLEECIKAEDEHGMGKVKAKRKIKVAAATTTTSSPSYSDAFAKQLKKQQQQFDALMGKVQAMVTTLQAHNAMATSSSCQGNPSFGMRGRGGCPFTVMVGLESLEVEAFLHMADGGGSLNHRGPTPNNILHIPNRSRGMLKPTLIISVGNVVK